MAILPVDKMGRLIDTGHPKWIGLAPMVTRTLDHGQMTRNTNKNRRTWLVAIAFVPGFVLLLLLVMLSFNLDIAVDLKGKTQKTISEDQENPGTRVEAQKVRELLDKLRDTARLAAAGQIEYRITAAERAAWYIQNPCESRSELSAMYTARRGVRDISPNPMWDRVLAEYSNLHRICMKRVGNITDHFLHKSSVTVPGCKFLIVDGRFGLGNRMLVTVSALLYAIVSERIILMPSYLNSLLCEPFIGSSWWLDDPSFPLPESAPQSWDEFSSFTHKLNDRLLSEKEDQQRKVVSNSTLQPPVVDAIVVGAHWDFMLWMPPKLFYCITEQRYLSEVPWMYFSGCLYSIPEQFGSPAFGATLQALFPDRVVITRLLRSAFLPSDIVWSRLKHLNYVYFQNADRRVGIQLRIFEDAPNSTSKLLNDHAMDCVLKNGILPQLNESSSEDFFIKPTPSPSITTVHIASLQSDLHEVITDLYHGHPTVTGEAVRVVQITSRQEQRSGTEEDRQAFVEMLLLSISDVLLVTPTSTFGGMGQAYGGLTPWIIRATEDDEPSCQRAETIDPCEQLGTLGNECPDDPLDQPESNVTLANCLKIDLGMRINNGIQILDNQLSLRPQEL